MTYTAIRPNDNDAEGFDRAEAVEALVEMVHHDHTTEVRELLGLADFLASEVHRDHGAEEAAFEVAQWCDRDFALLAEAERLARREHHEDSARILHLAHDLVTAA